MANDKNTLLVQVANLLPDNNTGEISASDFRTVESASISAALNLFELIEQTAIGVVNFDAGIKQFGAQVWSATRSVIVNSIADLPAPVAGVITLLPYTCYFFGNNIAFDVNRIVNGSNTVMLGLDTLSVTLSYTGTLPFITCSNVSSSLKNLNVSHPNGPLFSWSGNSTSVLRVSDVTTTGASIGTLTGDGSEARFTNFSPVLSTNGIAFSGNWSVFLYEPSFGSIAAGSMFNLGTATFNQISISQPTYAISSGAFFLTGAIGSANINTGGRGVITLGGFTGAGTILSGITIGDALWEFHHNDDIQDTRPDALLSMQANATVTIIVTSGIYVKVAGLWSDFGKSQFNVTTDGRATYVGGKSARLPITFSLTSEPVSGNAKKISYKVAINGIIIDGSKRSGSSDAGFPTSVTIPWQYTFNTGDYVEIFATNDTDSIDILCSSAVARIN